MLKNLDLCSCNLKTAGLSALRPLLLANPNLEVRRRKRRSEAEREEAGHEQETEKSSWIGRREEGRGGGRSKEGRGR